MTNEQPDLDRARRRAIRTIAKRTEDPRVHAMLDDVLAGRKTLGQLLSHPAFAVLYPPREKSRR